MKKQVVSAIFLSAVFLFGCTENEDTDKLNLKKNGSMKLDYASQFTVDYYENNCAMIKISDGEEYFLVPEGMKTPEGLDENITVINTPAENIYLAASSAMDFFDRLDILDKVTMTSTKASDWSLENVAEKVENEDIAFVGKYNTPDYEYLISEECRLTVESTMIYHSPHVKEKIENSGIPVLVERSSYESHPLGRMEWIKLYGLLCGKLPEAEKFFDEQCSAVGKISPDKNNKKVVFFYITSNGSINVRKPDDYICEMIRMAGGEYIFTNDDMNTEENAQSGMNMQMEVFYEKAKDADIIIYNSTIDGGIDSISQLIEKNSLLGDFKAVKNGNVWCTDKNVYQKITGAAAMTSEMNRILNDDTSGDFTYFYNLGKMNGTSETTAEAGAEK